MKQVFENQVSYPASPPRFALLDRMMVERGEKADWDLLHALHYKAEGTPFGPKFWRLSLDGDTIGVMVTGSPKGLLKERHLAFPKLKPGGDTTASNTWRYKFVNKNFRVIARLVVDTRYRGIGLAYRFQNLASRMEGVRFMEIQSSMSKYNHFAQRAGFRFVSPRNSNKWEIGVKFMRATFEANPADHEEILAEIDNLSESQRERTLESVRDFYYRHSALEKTGGNRGKGTSRVDEMSPENLIRNLQQMVLASPLYGVYANPDLNRDLPTQLPLSQFDQQDPKEPLRL